jgi:glycosyltransferase involved in cell wall biosynthesis
MVDDKVDDKTATTTEDELIFSVVVPTLNRPAKIRKCLTALAAQDHTSFEVIVIDDGSTDDTPEHLKQIAKDLSAMCLTCLSNDEQMGANPSRNRGIQLAKGRYVAFLDDDCIADPNWLTELERGFTHALVAATTGLVDDQEPANIYELVFRGTHRLAKAGVARRLIAGNMAVKRELLLRLKWDIDRAAIQKTKDGQPDTSVSGRGDEEGLHLRLHAYGYDLVATPAARVLHEHPYTRSSFFRQAQKGGRSAAKLVYKFSLKQRIDMVFFMVGYASLLLGVINTWLLLIPFLFLGLAVAAVSYNDIFLKGKTVGQFIRGFPILLAYYHVRLYGYVTESLKLRLGLIEIDRADLQAEARDWHAGN